MAPFNTHFLIAEILWPEFEGPWQPHYDQFCFGCVAPDVDKISSVLTQKDTHFFDRTHGWELMISHRTAAFLQQQAGFFTRPFNQLPPDAQAFALGYLCHLCVDEVSKQVWQRPTWLEFKDIGPGPAFAALDEAARQQLKDYPRIETGIVNLNLLNVVPHISPADWAVFWRGVQQFVSATRTEAEFLALVDMFDRLEPAQRQARRRDFRANIKAARARVQVFDLPAMVEASLQRSRQRMRDLIAGRTPEPDYPVLTL